MFINLQYAYLKLYIIIVFQNFCLKQQASAVLFTFPLYVTEIKSKSVK